MRAIRISMAAVACLAAQIASAQSAVKLTGPSRDNTLDIYFIDVEGGQSTLIVTPAKQSFLIDTGFAADGKSPAKPGNPREARDANRILKAAQDAGVKAIDYLLITHFHGDHDGGVVELSQLLPIKTFIDHGSVAADAEKNVPGTLEAFAAYAKVRSKGKHLEPRPGDRLPLKGIDVEVVSAATTTLSSALNGAGAPNASCAASASPAQEIYENPRSTGVVIQFGRFRFLDLGDLSGKPLFDLACPRDLIGSVDAYLIAHHGGADSAIPATFAAFKPRVSILNNGTTKGGAKETLAFLRQSQDAGEVWQLHRSNAAGDQNVADSRIANLDEQTAHWLKLSAREDGSFTVANPRTGEIKSYPKR